MVCGRYRLDNQEYKCGINEVKFIESLVDANKKLRYKDQHDIELVSGESIYADFTVQGNSTIYRASLSQSLYRKIMDKLIQEEGLFDEHSITFIVESNVDIDDIDIVSEFTTSDVLYDFDVNNTLIDVVISCREHIPYSGQLIAQMRCAVIEGIIA